MALSIILLRTSSHQVVTDVQFPFYFRKLLCGVGLNTVFQSLSLTLKTAVKKCFVLTVKFKLLLLSFAGNPPWNQWKTTESSFVVRAKACPRL